MGQVGNLRPIGIRPLNNSEFIYGPITNRPQITNLPHKWCLSAGRGRPAWAWAESSAAESAEGIEFGLLVGRQDCVECGVRFALDG